MKRIVPLLLLALAFCAGCATHYDITLNNGEIITSLGKPKYDAKRSIFIYKDGEGQMAYVPQGQVRRVQPTSMRSENKGNFIN